jgi:hypothetical protein
MMTVTIHRYCVFREAHSLENQAVASAGGSSSTETGRDDHSP